MQQPDIHRTTEQAEFHIELEKILSLVDPNEILDTDVWSYVDGGSGVLVLVRKRETVTNLKAERSLAALKAMAQVTIQAHTDETPMIPEEV